MAARGPGHSKHLPQEYQDKVSRRFAQGSGPASAVETVESGGGAAEGRGKSLGNPRKNWHFSGKIMEHHLSIELKIQKKRGLMGCAWNLKKDNGDFMGFYQDDAPVSQDLVETCWLKHTWLRGSTLCEVPEGRKVSKVSTKMEHPNLPSIKPGWHDPCSHDFLFEVFLFLSLVETDAKVGGGLPHRLLGANLDFFSRVLLAGPSHLVSGLRPTHNWNISYIWLIVKIVYYVIYL